MAPVQRVGCGERKRSRDRLVKGDAAGIEIAARINRPVHAAGLLGRHVSERSRDCFGRSWRLALAWEVRRNAETRQPDRPGRAVNEDIGRLDIFVDEASRMARLTTMGELTASIAHEINQPLAAIVTQSEAASRFLDRDEPDLDEVQDALSAIRQDGMRAGEVIRGLRALARKSGPQLAKLDIDDVIREVLALAGGELRRHDVVLQGELAADERPVMVDRVQLQQVLLNLIMNGVEAMKGVTERARELTVSSTLAVPGSVLVAVEDTGTGVDPAVADRMFQPFFTTKSDGLGMGLAICRSIIEAHGGRLWVSPRAPHGADVRFTIPLWAEQ